MCDTRRKLLTVCFTLVGLVTVAGILAGMWLALAEPLHPLWLRLISESDPEGGRLPPEVFERFRREQDDIANGEDRGPIRCTLSPWPNDGGEHPPDLALTLTNTSAEPVTLWHYTWLHAHVTFIVRDEDVKIAASFHWGTLSSQAVSVDPETGRPSPSLPTRTLKPGETYTTGIFLSTLADCCDGHPEKPSRYRVEVVFVYSDLYGWPAGEQRFVARSKAVAVEVGEPDADDKKPSWRLQ